jgi:hypothetical protein
VSELYETSVVLSSPVPIVPLWAVNLQDAVNNMQAAVNNLEVSVGNLQVSVNNMQTTLNNIQGQIQQNAAEVREKFDQLPIIIANSQAGNHGALRNPTQVVNGWAPHLVPPNPQTRDELFLFTGESSLLCTSYMHLMLIMFMMQLHNAWPQLQLLVSLHFLRVHLLKTCAANLLRPSELQLSKHLLLLIVLLSLLTVLL